jgi:LmbE family N-acetylglucosaminyl deacetylase
MKNISDKIKSMRKVRLFWQVNSWLLGIALSGALGVSAQAPESLTSAEIFLRLKKLNVLGSVLYVAAHPDDENSRLIAYMAKDRLYRTGYLSMTRGDGGQNLIGDEQGVELGLIRTQEMLAARRIDGADQFFSRAFDFGFSKSTEEAMKTWDKEKILSDVVWVIRRFQPDVIITRFPPDSRAGHGHHSASAVLAHEAFLAAADPSRFPEQMKYGVKPWQAKRLLWNTFNFGATNTTSDDQMKIDVGVYNPVLGKSYGEIAAESRTQHKSQGAALTPARGQSLEYFTLVAGDPAHNDPMENIDLSWGRVGGASNIQAKVGMLIKDYSLSDPERSIPGLVDVYREIGKLPDGFWKDQKLKEVRQLVEACSGLWLEATVRSGYAAQGDSVPVSVVLNSRLPVKVSVTEIGIGDYDSSYRQDLATDKNYFFSHAVFISGKQPVTQPYWLVDEMSPGSFTVKDQSLIGDPQSKPALEARFTCLIEGQEFVFTRPVRYKFTDAVKGELYEPLTILPPVTGQFDPALVVFTDWEERHFDVQTKIETRRTIDPVIELTPTKGLSVKRTADFRNSRFTYAASPAGKESTVLYSDLTITLNGKRDTAKELKTISYDHIPRIDYFHPAIEKFVLADIRTAGRRIGYIEGAGDKVPQALRQMGYEVVFLKEKELISSYLKQFDAILTGVRAFDVHNWLADKHEILMDYVKEGGNLIVQYNRSNIGNANLKIGPYPFAVSNTRVTDENAKVNFLIPAHDVLNYPNKITGQDFEGWIQERGIYFAEQTDPAYESILSMNDPDEQEHKGSLVVARYGKGDFVYTGLVFFRELPAGVPGAYRLLANMIALNQKKGF